MVRHECPRASPWLLCRNSGTPYVTTEVQPMPVSKYIVSSTCLSCNRRVSGQVIAIVTTVREDDHQPRASLVHEGCQSAMLRELPFDDEPEPETGNA